MSADLRAATVNWQLELYSGALHGFTNTNPTNPSEERVDRNTKWRLSIRRTGFRTGRACRRLRASFLQQSRPVEDDGDRRRRGAFTASGDVHQKALAVGRGRVAGDSGVGE